MSSPSDLSRALHVFEQVVELTGTARDALLDELCAGDTTLKTKVQAMLAADACSDDPFDAHDGHWHETLAAAMDGSAWIGRVLGAWKIIAVTGRGGMGNVYEVERADGAYAQRAALKLIRAAADSVSVRSRFLRERQILAQLRHKNIAALLDGGITDDGDPYFVMEYVEGVPVDCWCDDHQLNVRERIALFLQILDAVSHAHRNLLVHRDLKTSNLLVDTTGQIKLLDFGIAKQLHDQQLTAIADRAVTLGFASPEQLKDAPITTATDIWQLGILLHLLLTGLHPFNISPDMSLATQLQQLTGEPESLIKSASRTTASEAALRGASSPAALAKIFHNGLAAVVATCLRHDPAMRYASVDALTADLRAWLDNLPVLAANTPKSERARLWFRRNRMLTASLAAITVALIVGTAVSLWQAREAIREGARARESLQFLSDTLAAAAPEQALNSEVSVRQLLKSARQQLEQRSTLDNKVKQPVQRMLGRLYFSVGEYRQAAELLELGTRDIEPTRRDEALALADDLVVYSDTLAALERGADSVTISDRAAALRRHFASDDPEQTLRALAHQTLGHVEKYGWETCRKRAEAALAYAMRMPNPPPDVVLRLYSDLSSVANFTNDRDRLRQLSEQGLMFADQHHVALESPSRFTLLRNRIEGLLLDGHLLEAETLSRDAIAMAEKTGGVGSTRLSVLYSTLGTSLHHQGRYREAQTIFEHAFELMPRTDTGPRNMALAQGNLALVHADAGDSTAALRLMARASEEMNAAGIKPEDPFNIELQSTYIHVLLASRHLAQATAQLDQTLALIRKTMGEGSDEYARLLGAAMEAARQSRNVTRGEQLLTEARARATQHGIPETHLRFAQFLRYEASFALLRGDLQAAERAQREALQKMQSDNNTFTIALARAELARILKDRGNRSEARTLIEQALPVLRQSVLPQQPDLMSAEVLAGELGVSNTLPKSQT
ncbi:MAG TPA: serine/threonine-protein kinase [Steroidobacteraceae bacterium]|nr:serine/threonine-protein kinase [Steroidobacteraceae bacterium]